MSDFLKNAFGYLSSSSAGSQSHQGGGISSGGGYHQQDDPGGSLGVGEVIEVGRSRVKLNRLIAEGGFSYVFKAMDLDTNNIVAVKKMIAADAEAKSAVQQEKDLLGQFSHPHVGKFLGAVTKQGQKGLEEHYLVLEYCPGTIPTPPLRTQHVCQIFAQSCKAVKYLHEFGIVHRDIKLENLLIGSDGLVKLVDFGSATMEKFYPSPDWSMNQRTRVEEAIAAKTTPMYRAPEMLDLWSNYPIDERGDYWALGCLLFALSAGTHPFQDSNKLAITNANYSFPKSYQGSSAISELIKGLLKVDPAERLSMGGIMDILVSISEAEGFSLSAPLPFKASVTPPEELPPSFAPQQGGLYSPEKGTAGGGIVNPLSSAYQGFSLDKIKGGAASLIKNIKEQGIGAYLGNPGQGQPSNNGGQGQRPGHQHQPPPPRPPGGPHLQRKDETLQFENREYEERRRNPEKPPPPRPAPPSPVAPRRGDGGGAHPPPRPVPPSPRSSPLPQRKAEGGTKAPAVANLLDMSFDSGVTSSDTFGNSNVPVQSSNSALLDDLFGGGGPTQNAGNTDDFFWSSSQPQGQTPMPPSTGSGTGEVDLLGDPLASLLGRSAPTQSQHQNFPAQFPTHAQQQTFLGAPMTAATSMGQSASFQNLQSASSGIGTGFSSSSSSIPKNSSSPNLLSDLILQDIFTASSGGGIGGINLNSNIPSTATATATATGSNSNPNLNNSNGSSKPNYARSLFTEENPSPGDKKATLNDVFGEFLSSQGFSSSSAGGPMTINELRKTELLSNPNANPTQIKVNEWREGKKKNIRALLSSLHTITWEGCGWEETNMSTMITPAQVKKTYRKACLSIHPDKQMGSEWEELAKMIFVELNEAWAAFEENPH